jgi:hypothetical protein
VPSESSEHNAQRKKFEKKKAAYLETLGKKLVQLHGLLTKQAADEEIERFCWKILRGAEGKLLRKKSANRKGEIITRGWEYYWDLGEHLSWGGPVGFGDIEHDPVSKQCFMVFREMMRLAKWMKGQHDREPTQRPHGKTKQKAQLREAIHDYLESRGIETHKDGDEPFVKAAQGIHPNRRTIPLPLGEAARLMGYKGDKNLKTKKLRAAIDTGAVTCEKLTRQQFVFDKHQFPKEVWNKLSSHESLHPKSP